MKKTVIELKDVWKTYNMGKVKVNALQGVSIKINKGEFLAIIGKSGSGKSTIMNLIGCLDIPSKGNIFLDSRDIAKLNESKLAQIRGKKIGFIFQQFNLINTLNALENVTLPGEFQNMENNKVSESAKQLLEFVDMKDRLHHKPSQLSGGQMQRVAIARALINDPEIILADEPTGALDSKTGEQVLNLLKELNRKKGKSLVIVTHDHSIAKHADRIIELSDGKVLKEYYNGRKHENN
ncbi:ABC transporter ATP-binding protein [Candidatus Woesearchaeota archaeon]|nr:ABC transporter ATP-binding protein [Candidatus Woesearchaeota archaeon]